MSERDARRGVVYLVGAGPGAADLITVRGLRVLRSADVVLYDALLSPDLLREARSGAELVAVGKRGYCVGSTRQEAIQDALVRLARGGKSVCRLKGGDPCVFGRGGEEAEALAEAGVPFEVVPGVTAASGACAAALIPLTHRGDGQSVTLVTGHHEPASPDCTLDWAALARLPTVVFYMAARHVGAITRKLVEHGMAADTPAAVVEAGTPGSVWWRDHSTGSGACPARPACRPPPSSSSATWSGGGRDSSPSGGTLRSGDCATTRCRPRPPFT